MMLYKRTIKELIIKDEDDITRQCRHRYYNSQKEAEIEFCKETLNKFATDYRFYTKTLNAKDEYMYYHKDYYRSGLIEIEKRKENFIKKMSFIFNKYPEEFI